MFSFLTERYQYVQHKDDMSCLLKTFRGVPQGSILSPILFMTYINDLYYQIKFCKLYSYADDVQLLGDDKGQGIGYLQRHVNCDLQRVNEWSEANILHLNSTKTRAMWFSQDRVTPALTLDGERIEFVSYYKTLGVYIDDKLEFSNQVNHITSRVNYVVKRLYNIGIYLPNFIKRQVALSLCLPIFLYGLEIYSGMSQQNILKLKQSFNRVIRYIYGIGYRDHRHMTSYVVSILGLDFDDFIKLRIMLQFYKIFKYGIPPYLAERFSFGQSSRTNSLNFPRYSTLMMSRSFVVRVTRLWNEVVPYEERRFSKSISSFKQLLLNLI